MLRLLLVGGVERSGQIKAAVAQQRLQHDARGRSGGGGGGIAIALPIVSVAALHLRWGGRARCGCESGFPSFSFECACKKTPRKHPCAHATSNDSVAAHDPGKRSLSAARGA